MSFLKQNMRWGADFLMTLFTQKKFRVGDKSVYNNPKHLGAKLAQNWPNEQTSAALDLGKLQYSNVPTLS